MSNLVGFDIVEFFVASEFIQTSIHKMIKAHNMVSAVPLVTKVETISHEHTIAESRLKLMLMFVLSLVWVVINSQAER